MPDNFSGSKNRDVDGAEKRRGVELGAAVLGGVMVLGAVAGNGVASTALSTSDGSTWLADGSTGQIVQLDPTTGRTDERLQVGPDGTALDIEQGNGFLVVTDADGNMSSIDLAQLIASGSRSGTSDNVKVLIGKNQMFMADLANGTLRSVDPSTLNNLGAPYRSRSLADAVVDGEGKVWIADGKAVRELRWDGQAERFVVVQTKKLKSAGRNTRLTPHSQGVSVFAPDGGVVVQLGTGRRGLSAGVRSLKGEVAIAKNAPSDLVPASVTSEGTVVMVSGDRVLTVAVRDAGCDRPGAPAVFADKVYVPCTGDRRVIALDRQGQKVGSDVLIEGSGDPQLLVDEGRLIIQSGDKTSTVTVDKDGSSRIIDTSGGRDKVRDGRRRSAIPVNPQWGKPLRDAQQNTDRTRQSNVDGEHKQDKREKPKTEARANVSPTATGGKTPSASATAKGGAPTDACTGDDCPVADACIDNPAAEGCEKPDEAAGEGQGQPNGSGKAWAVGSEGRYATAVSAVATGARTVEVTWTPPLGTAGHIEVVASDGVSATVAANADRASLDGVQCGVELTIDVVAVYADPGAERLATSAVVTMPACEPGPQEAPAPENGAGAAPKPAPVTNLKTYARTPFQSGSGPPHKANTQVTLSWSRPASQVDYYIVRSSAGTSRTVPARQSIFTYSEVFPDDTALWWEVVTVLGDQQAVARVDASGVPGLVENLTATADSASGEVRLSFNPPPGTGSGGVLVYEMWCLAEGETTSTKNPTLQGGTVPVPPVQTLSCAGVREDSAPVTSVAVAAMSGRTFGPIATARVAWGPPGTGEAAARNVTLGVVTTPWTPQLVENPPMLGAGVALIVPVVALRGWRGVRRLHARWAAA